MEFYKEATGIILMYDITDKKSFRELDTWITEAKDNGADKIPFFVCGAKKDLSGRREV